jgi:mono/diheme cytochrome c family protein
MKNVRFVLVRFTSAAVLAVALGFGGPGAGGQSNVPVEADSGHLSHDHGHDHYAELTKVPEKARTRPNPLEHDPDAVAAGAKLYEQHCSECHGVKASGTKRGPSLRKEPVEHATPGALFWILSNGVVRHGMPDWSKLPEQQRWQLVLYLKSLGAAPPKPPEAKPANPPPSLAMDSPSPHR